MAKRSEKPKQIKCLIGGAIDEVVLSRDRPRSQFHSAPARCLLSLSANQTSAVADAQPRRGPKKVNKSINGCRRFRFPCSLRVCFCERRKRSHKSAPPPPPPCSFGAAAGPAAFCSIRRQREVREVEQQDQQCLLERQIPSASLLTCLQW